MKRRPIAQGLYIPNYEHDSCGVGLIADVQRRSSHGLLGDAETILVGLAHRGALGSENNTGDGAGVLTNLPDDFFRKIAQRDHNCTLPESGQYAIGLVFLPQDAEKRAQYKARIESVVERYQAQFLFWRELPIDNSMIGQTARDCEPHMEHLCIAAPSGEEQQSFERRLFLIRKYATHLIRAQETDSDEHFYICSLSSKTIVYKGMLTNDQLFAYYDDLRNPDYQAYVAMVHSRFSTNTFPSWDRAHPFRFLCHNGEINTIRGNINYMCAREGVLQSDAFGNQLQDLFPIIEPDSADSGNFDNALEFLHLTGRSLSESVLLMIPEAWQHHTTMSATRRAWYEYNSCLMEPWDGPASMFMCNGDEFAAILDRNGLRPVRYYLTTDDQVIMSSEVGVLPIDTERIKTKGRLQAGRLFLIDFNKKEIIDGEALKDEIASQHPYDRWLKEQAITLDDLPEAEAHPAVENLEDISLAFGCTDEHIRVILKPICETGKEPLGSMGNDAPLAVLSNIPRLHFDYFHQLFAQVTNPPIDSIRERHFMSIRSYIGPQKNLLTTSSQHCHRLLLEHPILLNKDCAKIAEMDHRGWRTKRIDISYPLGTNHLEGELERLCNESRSAIDEGYSLLLLSDRNVSKERLSIGALLATATVHHHLVREARRTEIGIVVETGESREVHHYCCLFGYGADAVNPYLAYEIMGQLSRDGKLSEALDQNAIEERYRNALAYGLRKVFGKMGISTLESYKSAQIFEIVGLSEEVVDRSFTGTASRVGGIGYQELAEEMRRWHSYAFPKQKTAQKTKINLGEYQWRTGQETHMWDPTSIALVRQAARNNDYKTFKKFSEHINNNLVSRSTLRGSMEFTNKNPIPIEEVEGVDQIVKRFVTGAMSFGSLSKEAHETLAVAMNRLGGKSNTGEGGEDKARYALVENGDSRRSAIKQVASGRFGVTIEYLSNADEIQIKMAQGAKPGEGGELPGRKVFDSIAKIRYSTPGVELISPPPHHDIYSIEDLAQLIFDLKNANPSARISVKLVAEVGVGTIAAGVAKAHADHILISGYEGGTGASPLTGIKHAGLPWELGISETHQILVMNDLRSRVVLQTDGQIKTGRDVVIAALLGAEECGFATAPLIVLGCIMMRKCEKNTCPVGIATQDETLRKKFDGKPEYVEHFMTFVAQEVREIMAELGYRSFTEMVGKVQHLRFDQEKLPAKSKNLSLEKILQPPQFKNDTTQVYCCIPQDHGIDDILDRRLIAGAAELFNGPGQHAHATKSTTKPLLELQGTVRNRDRAVGTMFSHELYKKFGLQGLDENSIRVALEGSAGQSFGAWLIKGVELTLYGDANDYPGKGLSGGTLVVRPPKLSLFEAEDNIIIGNVSFYGATMGRAFIRGQAAERFCVRNSGAHVVVEGLGDHGCEYMTGGRAVIIGPIGRNFAAGMSGGIVYLWYPQGDLEKLVNHESVEICAINEGDKQCIQAMLGQHHEYTESPVAEQLLEGWDEKSGEFVKIISPVYRRIIEMQEESGKKELVHG